ncbi:MAG: hypothetical protein IKG18_08230 [Atopobiaceae bacterium]|nr:hypothetical protein [Atopobiaceae bacterium]
MLSDDVSTFTPVGFTLLDELPGIGPMDKDDEPEDKQHDNDSSKRDDSSKDDGEVIEIVPSAYSRDHFLLFGGDASYVYGSLLDTSGAATYLQGLGFGENKLTQARKSLTSAQAYKDFDKAAERFCDFCGKPLTGVEYHTLRDGRDRCSECTRTSIRGRENFEALFASVKNNMMDKYAIILPNDITVRVVSQDKISKARGISWSPSSGFDPRAIGFVRRTRFRQSLWLENGAPRLPLTATIAHELTHVWQHANWDQDAMKKLYGAAYLVIAEGMAMWSEIQYLYLINETRLADRTFERERKRNDEYGIGLNLYVEQYSMTRGIVLEGETPFRNRELPLDPSLIRK